MKTYAQISGLFQALNELLFPRLCCACRIPLNNSETFICISCLYQLPFTDHHLYAENKTARKFWGRIPFHAAMALLHFRKGNRVQQLIHHLKYKGKKQLGNVLGLILAEQLRNAPLYQGIDLIIPVPLHKRKEKSRGYNQSDCIAKGLSKALNIPIASKCLIRHKATGSQTRKNRFTRFENMKDVFLVLNPNLLSGKHILLVDDVITTGATIEACAIALQPCGMQKLSIAAVAFAD